MGVNALDLAVFVSGSFVGALASQVAGFAYGLVAAAVWLQLLMPMQTVTLIIAFGPVVQGVAGWELRPTPEWRVLWPLLAGATVGVPVGAQFSVGQIPRLCRQRSGPSSFSMVLAV